MIVRAVALAVSVSLAAVAPSAAATGKHAHPLRTTAVMRLVSSTGNPPNGGATGTEQGTISGGTLGRGRATFALVWSALRTFSGSIFLGPKGGNLRGTIHGHGTLQPDGTTAVTGAGRITNGTGRRRGARGSYTFTATVPASGGPLTVHLHGTVRY